MPDVLSHFSHVQKAGAGWTAHCPAHDDRRNSLSIGHGEKQPWLLKCHAGCSTEAIIEAAGLTMTDILTPRNGNSLTPREIVATYDYCDERGTLLYQVCRFAPKEFRQRRPDGHGGSIWNLENIRRVLFGLNEFQGQRVVYIPEGEKDVLALRALGLTATCNAGGAGKWRDDYSQQLVSAGVTSVVVLPDNDDPGRQHADSVARSCLAAALQVKVIALPGLPVKGDLSDWLGAGHTKDELIGIVKATPLYAAAVDDAAKDTLTTTAAPITPDSTQVRPTDDGENRRVRESQATAIVRLVTEAGAEWWHTPSGDAYLTIRADEHTEHYALNSRATKDYASRLYYGAEGKAPNASGLADAINTLSGLARFDGDEHRVHVRVAAYRDRIYVDLCDSGWRAIEVTSDGWDVVARSPVRFRRAKGMLPIPEPERGGSIAELRPFLNVASDDDFVMVVSWLVQALRPSGPYPVTIALGEQGSSKSTFCRILRRLVDPNVADTRSEPREVRDLAIAADNGFVLCFDNLSRLPEWLSDALCRLATGGGFATRTLYENREEEIFDAQRPTILNGISQVATRPDLLDRAIVITLPAIPDTQRRPEAEFWAAFEAARPRILGALLDAVVVAIRRHREVRLESLPRMADFAVWSVAAEGAFPWTGGTFLTAYAGNRQGAVDDVLDGDPLVEVVQR